MILKKFNLMVILTMFSILKMENAILGVLVLLMYQEIKKKKMKLNLMKLKKNFLKI